MRRGRDRGEVLDGLVLGGQPVVDARSDDQRGRGDRQHDGRRDRADPARGSRAGHRDPATVEAATAMGTGRGRRRASRRGRRGRDRAASPRGTPRARTYASVRSLQLGRRHVGHRRRGPRADAPERARAPRRTPRSRRGGRPRPAPSGVSPAISRSSPPGSTAASSSASRTAVVIHPRPIRPGGHVPPSLADRHRRRRRSVLSMSQCDSSASRRRRSARRVRVFTVPSGQSRRSAISDLRQPVAIGQHDDRPLLGRHPGERRSRSASGSRSRPRPPPGPIGASAPPMTTPARRDADRARRVSEPSSS